MKSKLKTNSDISLITVRKHLNEMLDISQCSKQYWWNKDAIKAIVLTINPDYAGPFEPANQIFPKALIAKWKRQETIATHPNRENTIMLYNEVYDALSHATTEEARPQMVLYPSNNNATQRFKMPIIDFYKIFIKAHHESTSYEKLSYLLQTALEDYHDRTIVVKSEKFYWKGGAPLRTYFSSNYNSYLKSIVQRINKRFSFINLKELPNKEVEILTVEEELSIWYNKNY